MSTAPNVIKYHTALGGPDFFPPPFSDIVLQSVFESSISFHDIDFRGSERIDIA